ncbi:MAG: hypothetical protein ACLQKA_17575 [Bryobacteraceae bacterium]
MLANDGARRITRREWARLTAGAALLAAARTRARATALSWDTPTRSIPGTERKYRVDAQVVLFSVPLLRRSGVGAGTVAWWESSEADGTTRVLDFAAYSFPQHAAGLNRLGFIQERIRLAEAGMVEAIYFGLMTASAEESADEARKALHPTDSQVAYTAVEARVESHSMQTATANFMAPSSLSAAHHAQLEQIARQALAAVPRKSVGFADAQTPPPFLQAMAELLRQPKGGEGRYIYNGRVYRLRLRRAADPKASEHFRARGLASGPVMAVTGALQRVSGGKPIDFRLWVEESAAHPVPLRIEYQPKSYLRLAFEAEA